MSNDSGATPRMSQTPALLISTSIRPWASMPVATTRATSASTDTSPGTTVTVLPLARHASATPSRRSAERAVSTRSAPASAKPCANPSPSPIDAPVIEHGLAREIEHHCPPIFWLFGSTSTLICLTRARSPDRRVPPRVRRDRRSRCASSSTTMRPSAIMPIDISNSSCRYASDDVTEISLTSHAPGEIGASPSARPIRHIDPPRRARSTADCTANGRPTHS